MLLMRLTNFFIQRLKQCKTTKEQKINYISFIFQKEKETDPKKFKYI